MQVIGELPLGEWPRGRFGAPEIVVVHDARDEPAAPVVTQNVTLVRRTEKLHGAATLRFAFELTARAPIFGIEPRIGQIAGTGGVI